MWQLVARAEQWRTWTAFRSTSLEREGEPAPDGVGAIRRFGFASVGSREEVVAFEPPTHLGYVLLSGLPVQGYRSDVTLTPTAGGGTTIAWVSSFDARAIDGWFWAGFLKLLLTDFTRRLAKASVTTR